MMFLKNDKKYVANVQAGVILVALSLFATTASGSATHDELVIYLGPGFNVVETDRLPHVSCHNSSSAPGTTAYARAYMDPGLTGYDRYRLWMCHGGPGSFSSQLSLPPDVGDLIEHKIHAVSDGWDPVILIGTHSYVVTGVSCRNLTQGGPAVTPAGPVIVDLVSEQWVCDFGASTPAPGDSVLMIVQGTYF